MNFSILFSLSYTLMTFFAEGYLTGSARAGAGYGFYFYKPYPGLVEQIVLCSRTHCYSMPFSFQNFSAPGWKGVTILVAPVSRLMFLKVFFMESMCFRPATV